MARARLKTPQGQRSQAKGDEVLRPTFASPHIHTEPAQLMYETFVKALAQSPLPPPRKYWHQLSVYERAAWRLLMNDMITAAGRIPVPIPPKNEVALTISKDDVYVSHHIPITDIKTPEAKKQIQAMQKELERILAEQQDNNAAFLPGRQDRRGHDRSPSPAGSAEH